MMSLAETWGLRDKHSNPCKDIERYPERKRERFLCPTELQRLGQALTAAEVNPESKYAVAALRLLLLTGCRLSEIQTLEWRYVDLEQKELRLPDSKTGAKTVHLGDAVVVLLDALPRVTGNPYVIVGKKEKAHLTDLQHPWRRIRKAAGLNDVRIHDLRHTFASGGLLVGEGLAMIGKLLGHTQVQTTARYAHLASDPVKQAATKISDRLASALLGPVDRRRAQEAQHSSETIEDETDDDAAAA
jgi:integrase